MTTLALFTQELSGIENAIALLTEQIAQHKQQKKQLLTQAKIAQKAIDAIAAASEQLSESAMDGLKSAIANLLGFSTTAPNLEISTVTVEAIEQEDQTAELVEQPQAVNDSNEYFTWQPTSNDAVAVYFNVLKGKNHCLYLSANNKANLSLWGDRISDWLEGKVKIELRLSKRMPYKYELKIVGNISDDLVGTLTQFNIGKSPSYQLSSRLEDCPETSRTGQSYELACPTVLIGQKFESTNATWTVIEAPHFDSERGLVARCACLAHTKKNYVGSSSRIAIDDLLSFKLFGFMPTNNGAPDWHLERVSNVFQHYKMFLTSDDGTFASQHIGFVSFDDVNSRWYGTKSNSAVSVVFGSTKNECAIALRTWYIDTYRQPGYYDRVGGTVNMMMS